MVPSGGRQDPPGQAAFGADLLSGEGSARVCCLWSRLPLYRAVWRATAEPPASFKAKIILSSRASIILLQIQCFCITSRFISLRFRSLFRCLHFRLVMKWLIDVWVNAGTKKTQKWNKKTAFFPSKLYRNHIFMVIFCRTLSFYSHSLLIFPFFASFLLIVCLNVLSDFPISPPSSLLPSFLPLRSSAECQDRSVGCEQDKGQWTPWFISRSHGLFPSCPPTLSTVLIFIQSLWWVFCIFLFICCWYFCELFLQLFLFYSFVQL